MHLPCHDGAALAVSTELSPISAALAAPKPNIGFSEWLWPGVASHAEVEARTEHMSANASHLGFAVRADAARNIFGISEIRVGLGCMLIVVVLDDDACSLWLGSC